MVTTTTSITADILDLALKCAEFTKANPNASEEDLSKAIIDDLDRLSVRVFEFAA